MARFSSLEILKKLGRLQPRPQDAATTSLEVSRTLPQQAPHCFYRVSKLLYGMFREGSKCLKKPAPDSDNGIKAAGHCQNKPTHKRAAAPAQQPIL